MRKARNNSIGKCWHGWARIGIISGMALQSVAGMAQADLSAPHLSTDTVAHASPLLPSQPDSAGRLHLPGEASPQPTASPYRFKPLQLAIPCTLIGIGIIGLESHWIISRNQEIREELQEHINSKFTIDDFSQYTPVAATYALNLCGVKGKHGYADLTIIAGTAYALMGISVNTLKKTSCVERPDGSAHNSFPSGHTAMAFTGAELLRREYWDVSPWIGVAGYAVAAGTGFFRMYNNRHWFTDVLAGAGIGILSVDMAYWLYPLISKAFFRKRYLKNAFISPYLSGDAKGLSCSIKF